MTISQTALTKRIKRHVIGRVRDYFAATSPGLEKICFDELMSLPLSVRSAVVVPGGVEFKGRIQDCYLANLNLRTASRVLMRITVFKAESFKELEERLTDFPWELFLCPGALSDLGSDKDIENFLPSISVTTKHSRLYHKAAIGERFHKSISARLSQPRWREDISFISESGNGAQSCNQQLFVRAKDDRFTVSIDSSGEILYKRGIKRHPGSAPLRETVGAAALKLAGYDSRAPLIDPMCGSGTFSLEAAMLARNMPPGWFREFAFMAWPSFRPQRWAYIRREAEKEFVRVKKPIIFASDNDPDACDILKRRIKKQGFSGVINVSYQDFFEFSPSEITERPGLVVLNPPYGIRVGTPKESEDLFHAICHHLKKVYKGWKLALIVPNKPLAKTVPFQLKAHSFYHGGLKLVLLTGRIE